MDNKKRDRQPTFIRSARDRVNKRLLRISNSEAGYIADTPDGFEATLHSTRNRSSEHQNSIGNDK